MLRSLRRLCKETWRDFSSDWSDGITKTRNHHSLPSQAKMELRYGFPKLPHFQGRKIIYRIRKNERKSEGGKSHPALDTWRKFKTSIVRHPTTYTTKARVEAARHLAVLEQHQNWAPTPSFNSLKILETMDVFGPSAAYKPRRRTITEHGGMAPGAIKK
eukprot:GEMP01058024.1.p1 GENE.GEMP01058024.1~~GEMP01058024.1.p1  ORF type:complete len:170 (+),score=13.46 GEMP01058024.1:34-510(+)